MSVYLSLTKNKNFIETESKSEKRLIKRMFRDAIYGQNISRYIIYSQGTHNPLVKFLVLDFCRNSEQILKVYNRCRFFI